MQPYFMPYAGYFRLLAATDLFVVYDCVQFPRRGWVHRNKLPDAQGRLQWLTLPLAAAELDTTIHDLRFRAEPRDDFERQMRRFPSLAETPQDLRELLLDFSATPVDYLERTLAHACRAMGIPFRTVRSSTLGLPDTLRGQDRILAIAKAFGATRYLNASGGTALYDAAEFASQGIELQFLPEWQGDFSSVLDRLLREPPERIADDVRRQCTRP